jgi:hypothetical protein
MTRKVHFEIPKSRREVGVFIVDAMTVEAASQTARGAEEVTEDQLTIVRINPEDIPAFIRWSRALYKEWLKTQPQAKRGHETTRRINLDIDEEDGDDDAI